jgi:pyrimidine-nucleoside phosphorylase
MIDEIIYSGRAAEKIKEFIGNQGGDPDVLEYPDSILPKAKEQVVVKADKGGYILSLDAEKIGIGAMLLGAGRSKKEDVIDPAVGIMMNKKAGMPVKNGEAVATLHINNKENLEQAVELVRSAVTVAEGPVQKPVLIKEIVE